MKSSSLSAVAATAVACASTVLADINLFSNVDEFNQIADASQGFPGQRFRSSDIIAPVFQVNAWDQDGVDDAPYIFIGSVYGERKAGPMILDARDLSLVYADQRYENTYCSDVQEINGTRYFAFWEGGHTRGHANGYCHLYDENYHLKYKVTAKGLEGALADMHEMSITHDGNVIFSTYFNIPFNCSRVGGPEDALLMDSGFQEVDPVTNELLFDWSAAKHFDVADTFARYDGGYGVGPDSGFDFFHINSIRKTRDGNYLISARHMSFITLISGVTGDPIWVLGGKRNQFHDLSDGKATNIGWQHDARFFQDDETQITLFDNHGQSTGPCEHDKCKTRGLHLQIDPEAMTARVVQEYFHPQGIDSGAMGGFQTLENGNAMVGWGYNPGFVEFRPDGTPVLDVQRGRLGKELGDMFAYRVSKGRWTGRPTWPPSLAIDAPEQSTMNATIYVSWNGATDVAEWAILGSDNATAINGHENFIASANRTGFETEIYLGINSTHRYIGAAALTADGDIIGSSYVFDMENGMPVIMPSDITSVYPPSSPKASGDRAEALSAHNLTVGVGAVAALGLAFYVGRYFWVRRSSAGGEQGRYKRVGLED
ncbi:hypothetical protein HJFPF1_02628 [Paramyrothecium foliicola]|nr:hypothetical protein HJFPF1_02628 [Paramyrothecium foliicola]